MKDVPRVTNTPKIKCDKYRRGLRDYSNEPEDEIKTT